jgi:hypothetical protein
VGAAATPDKGAWVNERLRDGVARLIDIAPSLDSLYWHRLHLLAAERLRTLGKPLPPWLAEQEKLAVPLALAATAVLERVMETWAQPVVVIKGPEIARLYPYAAARTYRDLDFLPPDASAMRHALVASGFHEIGAPETFVDAPHGRPLWLPEYPLVVEIHRQPNWPRWMDPPDKRELLDAAVPASFGPEGLLVPNPTHHVLLVAAHAWAHGPLHRLRDLLDVALLTEQVDRAEILRTARRWKLARLWSTTEEAVERLFRGERLPGLLRVWARNLEEARERTVLENHLGRWFGAYSTVSTPRAFGVMLSSIGADVRPLRDETWRKKLSRARLATRNAFASRSAHDRELGHRRLRREESDANAADDLS